MSVFDLLRFPVHTYTDVLEYFPQLPKPLQDEYAAWVDRGTKSDTEVWPTAAMRVVKIRQLIGELE